MKKTKNASTTDTPASNGVLTPSTPPPPDGPKMTPKELKSAFAEYEKADDAVEAARVALEEAMGKRSAIVERIASGAGRGPFSFKGTILTATSRTSKETGKSRWFFKGPGRSDLIEV